MVQNPFQDYQEPQIRAVTFDEFESIMKRRNAGGGNEPPEQKGSLFEQAKEYVRHNKFVLGNAINEIQGKSQLSNLYNQTSGMTAFDRAKIAVAEAARSFANAANPIIAAPVVATAKLVVG